MSDIDLAVKELIDTKNAKIQELQEKLERLAAENLALAQTAIKNGELKPLPENEAYKGVI